ncbi:MAG TPA: GNAT family N-acetyltransferase [Pyrinomonadaceae bacterium]|jgi:putative acetyltransferase
MRGADFEIFIRAADNKDCAKVQNLVFGILGEYGLTIETGGTDADIADIEANYLNRGGVFELIEDASGNLLGTIGLYPLDAETVELRKMYFDRRLRGRGVGKKMLERMIEKAGALGFKRIYLETASVLKEAAALYEKYGFQPTTEGIHSARCDAAYFLELDK